MIGTESDLDLPQEPRFRRRCGIPESLGPAAARRTPHSRATCGRGGERCPPTVRITRRAIGSSVEHPAQARPGDTRAAADHRERRGDCSLRDLAGCVSADYTAKAQRAARNRVPKHESRGAGSPS